MKTDKTEIKNAYLFWIKSSRGTDSKVVVIFKENPTKEVIENKLNDWCSSFGACHVSENLIHYGYKKIKLTNRPEIMKKYDLICKKKANIQEKWSELAAMLNPIKIP